jgi:hypothetical protein
VAGQHAHGFEVGSASHQRGQEVVAERVVAALGQLVTDEQRVQLRPCANELDMIALAAVFSNVWQAIGNDKDFKAHHQGKPAAFMHLRHITEPDTNRKPKSWHPYNAFLGARPIGPGEVRADRRYQRGRDACPRSNASEWVQSLQLSLVAPNGLDGLVERKRVAHPGEHSRPRSAPERAISGVDHRNRWRAAQVNEVQALVVEGEPSQRFAPSTRRTQ